MAVNDSFSFKLLKTTFAKRTGISEQFVHFVTRESGNTETFYYRSTFSASLQRATDYSGEHQTGNFIANKISNIIEKIGSYWFIAIIADNGSNRLCKTRWVSIYNTTNSIVHIRPAIDKILEEKPDIFTNQEVFKIVCDEDDIFYTLCKRISLIFEPIKRVINLLKNYTVSLANCFMRIVQIAIALKKIPTKICELATEYYKEAHYNDKEYHRLMSQLIKYKARVGSWKLEYSSNLTPSLWWDAIEDEHTDLQKLAKIISMIRKHSSNVEKELKLRDDFAEIELRNSVLNEMIFAEINNLESNKYEDKDELNIEDLAANNITMALQDLVDLSDPIFGADNNQEKPIFTNKETSMEFDSRLLV
ncbi:39318_t:CDS:2 [Gigaspora margarita]|uniref:39318_t:CDS:1 n=1 Tax=Gigaspora margarita TaxID=4874 RepID=A0ABN7VXR5_GIGMA|nr:39318_t:CDS:2 [Gigaspora margarita]